MARTLRFGRGALGPGILVLGMVSASCGADADAPTALEQLEGLAFVPAGRCELQPASLPFSDVSLERALVIDRFELTRGDLEAYYREHAPGERSAGSTSAEELPDREWPAPLTHAEAERVAGWRGMRLPTGREWVFVAVGGRGRTYPWGNHVDATFACMRDSRLTARATGRA